MHLDDMKARVASFKDYIAKRNSTTESQAMAQGFSDALLKADARMVTPPRPKPSDILGMSVASGMDPWGVRGYTATSWIDDLIEESKPTIKHLGRPKAKHD